MDGLAGERFDAIVIGGRPAGASLALRLGREGLRVLILERAAFPSAPPVSLPFLMNNAMRELDELGLSESDYAGDAPRLRRVFLELGSWFRTLVTIAGVGGRDYIYVVDRARLDTALWNRLASFPSVTRVEGAHVLGLERDAAGRVSGVRLRVGGGGEQRVEGGCVVGADGRYSLVARQAGANVIEENTALSTSLLYAYWVDVEPYESGEPAVQIHASGDGYSLIVMPTTEGRAGVVYQGRSDRFRPRGNAEAWYEAALRRFPAIWRRLARARRVSGVSGIRRFGNLFRQAWGPGWALTGDAFHQKDSIDAQGLYDALLESRLLAERLIAWKRGQEGWDEAGSRYQREALAATRPMFLATMDRLKREIYTDTPPLAARSALRWLMTDPEYTRRFALLVSRQIDPASWAPPGVILGAMARGIGRDLRRLARRR